MHCTALLITLAGMLVAGCAAPAPARSDPSQRQPQTPSGGTIQVAPGLTADRTRGEVVVDAEIAAREGWLEQLVCSRGTRDHESLLSITVQPSLVHAALLLVGAQPGAPGGWREVPAADAAADAAAAARGGARLEFTPPCGEPLEVIVRVHGADGPRDQPLCAWVRGVHHQGGSLAEEPFPCNRFVFAGSQVRANPPSLGPGEHFVADATGSVVGLVTFGDELVAFEEVIPDRVDVAPAEWMADTARIPPEGTRVQLVLRRVAEGPK